MVFSADPGAGEAPESVLPGAAGSLTQLGTGVAACRFSSSTCSLPAGETEWGAGAGRELLSLTESGFAQLFPARVALGHPLLLNQLVMAAEGRAEVGEVSRGQVAGAASVGRGCEGDRGTVLGSEAEGRDRGQGVQGVRLLASPTAACLSITCSHAIAAFPNRLSLITAFPAFI